tara:strand:- start:28 stop:516 length:489 start_codon:yes stop_codon:yes gene_type:complete
LASKRCQKARQDKIAIDPGYKLRIRLLNRVSSIIRKKRKSSGKVIKFTGLPTSDALCKHFLDRLPEGLKMSDHGEKWHVAHKIPLCYYDHSIESEARKAWSPENMTAMTAEQNLELSDHINEDQCMSAGTSVFPKWWNGEIPNDVEKKSLRLLVRSGIAPWD